jgi:predicted DNA binding CopG/RHH family protein
VPGIGGKERKYMTKINYTDAPDDIEKALENAIAIDDFLPSPDQLILKSEKEKITIAIDKRSLDLFKRYADKHNAKYQNMINSVVTTYADKFLAKK